jgi:hypothetical protein
MFWLSGNTFWSWFCRCEGSRECKKGIRSCCCRGT